MTHPRLLIRRLTLPGHIMRCRLSRLPQLLRLLLRSLLVLLPLLMRVRARLLSVPIITSARDGRNGDPEDGVVIRFV